MWKCLDCKKQFSVKVGTIFEDSAVGLDKWLTAIWLVANCEKISSYELARVLSVTQRTAWFMLHRIGYAVPDLPAPADETAPKPAAKTQVKGGRKRSLRERVVFGQEALAGAKREAGLSPGVADEIPEDAETAVEDEVDEAPAKRLKEAWSLLKRPFQWYIRGR